MKRLFPVGLFLVVFSVTAQQQYQKSDWEERYEEQLREQRLQEEGIKMLPAFPKKENLIEFDMGPTADFRFFVDATSLTVSDGVVRYTVVARSPSGVENVAYEALRCDAGQYRMYATGRSDGTWSPRLTPWRSYARGSSTAWHHTLARDYFCQSNRESVATSKEAVEALRRGGLLKTR